MDQEVFQTSIECVSAELQHVFKGLDDLISALVVNQNWLEVARLWVLHLIAAFHYGSSDYLIDLCELLVLLIPCLLLVLLVAEEVFVWQQSVDDSGDLISIIHALILHDLRN